MRVNKYILIFLICSAALVIAELPPKATSRIKRNVMSSFFSSATQRITEAFKMTIDQEKRSMQDLYKALDETVRDAAVAAVEYTQAGLDFVSVPAKVLKNVLDKNETTSYSDAIADPVTTYLGSVDRAFNSTKEAYQSFWLLTKKATKASFDVSIAFPHFGFNLLRTNSDIIRQALKVSLEQHEKVLGGAINNFKRLGQKFSDSGSQMFRRFARSAKLPRVMRVLQAATVGCLSFGFEGLRNKVVGARNFGLEVAWNLTNGGIFFNKAAFDLETLLQKYSMKIITEEDAANYTKMLEEHINATKNSIKLTEQSFRGALHGVVGLFQMSETHGKELLLALDYIKKNLKEDDPDALEMSKNLTLTTFKNIIQELGEVGGLIGDAGKQLSETSFTLATIVPHFGLSVLKRRVDILGEKFVNLIHKMEGDLLSVVHKFTSAGKRIVSGGKIVEDSSSKTQKVLESEDDLKEMQDQITDLYSKDVIVNATDAKEEMVEKEL